MLDGINRPVPVPGFHLSHPLSPHHGHSHCLPVICSFVIPFRSSLMVLAAGGDIERAVDLLEHHNAREMDSRSAALCLTRSDRPHEPPMSRHILLVPETVRREK